MERSRDEQIWKRGSDGRWIPPPLQSAFLDWLLADKAFREPRTQELWSEANGVSKDAPRRWKRDRRFREAWNDRLAELNVSPERMADITETLYTLAKSGDTNAAKLYLSYVAQISPPTKITVETVGIAELSDEQLRAQILELAAEMQGEAIEAEVIDVTEVTPIEAYAGG